MLSVKDELAGKRGNCPNPDCRQPVVVPALGKPANGVAPPKPAAPAKPVASAPKPIAPAPKLAAPAPKAPPPPVESPPIDNAEDVAADLLSDKVEEKKIEFIEFTCPQCDEPLKMKVELGGKQTQCPECKRIIKVPMPAKKDPNDWRGKDALPSGARREAPKALEGAWDPSKSMVSEEALEEAGALPDQNEPLTKKQIAVRVILGVSAASVLVFAVMLIWSWIAGGRHKKMMNEALQYASGTEGKPALNDEGAAVIHQAAGEYHVRRNEPECVKPPKGDEGAWNQFGKARARLGAARQNPAATVSNDSEAQLMELAVAQLAMGGDPPEVANGTRLAWKDVVREVGSTLALIRNPEARREALRWVARLMIEKKQAAHVVTLVGQVSSLPMLIPDSSDRRSSDAADALAAVGLELFKAGHTNEANNILQQLQGVYVKDEKFAAQVPPVTVEVVAFYLAMGQQPVAQKDEQEIVNAGQVVALVWQGKADEARQKAGSVRPPLRRFDALAAMAASGDKESAEAAAALAMGELGQQSLSAWALFGVVQAGCRSGANDVTMLSLADRVRDPALQGRAQLAVLRMRLAASKSRVDETTVEIVNAKTFSAMLARLEWMRHNCKHDSGSAKALSTWDDAMKPYGLAGAALGLQGD